MKITIALICFVLGLIAMLLSGCAYVKGERKPDGTLTVVSRRLIWASEGVDFSTGDTNGFSARLKVQKSNPDAAAIQALADGLGQAVAAGVKAAK